MAKDQTVRLRPSDLQSDRDAFAALKNMSDYKPQKDQFSVDSITKAQGNMVSLRDIEAQKQADLDSARDDATAGEWAFHNGVLGAKDQVKAQYGDDSNEYQSVGRKKVSERKSPKRRTSKTTPAK